MTDPNPTTNISAVAPQQQQQQETSLGLLDPLPMACDMSLELDGFQSDALYLCNLLSGSTSTAPVNEKISTASIDPQAGRLSFALPQPDTSTSNTHICTAKRQSSIISLSSEDQRELEQTFADMDNMFEPTPIDIMLSSSNNNYSLGISTVNAPGNTATMKNGFPEMDSIQLPEMPKIIHRSTSPYMCTSTSTNIKSTFASTDDVDTDAAAPRFRAFHEKKWDERLLELRSFRQQHGHSLVPHTYPSNPQLARWVKRQRRQHKLMEEGKQSTMTPERCELLESLGFVWDSHQAAWSEKIQDLRRYQAQNGHCLVPSSYKANMQLATWVKCQRRQYKLHSEGRPSAMTPQRISELESIGFVWELRSSTSA